MINEAASFAMLVHELVESRHDGNLRKMALHTGIPYMTLMRWERGEGEHPNVHRVMQLCTGYDLELADVVAIIGRDSITRVKGGRPALPIIKRTPGPKPDPLSKRSRKRFGRAGRVVGAVIFVLGALVAAGRPTETTPAFAAALAVGIARRRDVAKLRLIGEFARLGRWAARLQALWRSHHSDGWGRSESWLTTERMAA